MYIVIVIQNVYYRTFWRGLVISTAQEWKSGSIHWLSVLKLLEPRRSACIS